MKRTLISSFVMIGFAAFAWLVTPSSSANPSPKTATFNKDVAPIFFKKCAECHRPGESAPMSLLSYKDARPWAKSIREKVVSREMPPWHADPHVGEFSNDRRLTKAEIDAIAAWVDGGAQEGDPKDQAPAPQFTDGWGIGKPDLVLEMPEPYSLDAGGPDEYQLFDIPTKFTEDKYVQMAEARPGNRKIVHHIIAFVLPPGTPTLAQVKRETKDKAIEASLKDSPFYREGSLIRTRPETPVYDNGAEIPEKLRDSNGLANFLTAYAPGRDPDNWAPGTAKKISAGSSIRLEVHYSKVAGSAQIDRSLVGLVFAKEPPRQLMQSRVASNSFFKIPAGAENHKVTAVLPIPRDIRVYTLMPHMHLRGKAMEYKVVYPDGKSEALLNVPNYSFSWQTSYRLKVPKAIPRGSRIEIAGYFDNSARNKFNPDPSKDVRYGEPTYDEMMMGLVEYVVEWPTAAKVDPKRLDDYVGRYAANNRFATVLKEGDRLMNTTVNGRKFELIPIGKDKFYLADTEIEFTFLRDEKGEVIERQVDTGGAVGKQKKVKEPAAGSGN
jgi:mono/diheme cytochrome c family protein